MTVKITPARVRTQKSLELAIKRIQQGEPKIVKKNTKLSIAAVAREAGISNSTVHNRYPEVVREIHKLVGSSLESKHSTQQRNIKDCLAKLRQARKEIEQLKSELAKSQSINLRLMKENEILLKKV